MPATQFRKEPLFAHHIHVPVSKQSKCSDVHFVHELNYVPTKIDIEPTKKNVYVCITIIATITKTDFISIYFFVFDEQDNNKNNKKLENKK